uniref:Immunoglobulin C1-set domain-containing protein n=1 Tax=Pygocentrus nattereri TaxID=42514 RepID=A0A3B4DVA6_PYGNA
MRANLCLLCFAGSHSLCSVATFIIGETPFPEFIAPHYDKEQGVAKMVFGALHKRMLKCANFLKQHFNYTNGVHTEQRLDCCELLSNNTAGQMRMIDAFNGLRITYLGQVISPPVILQEFAYFPTHDSGGASVTCLITGFYPRHINLTLLRNSQPVSEHLVSGGELLPNGDETYQMRKSLRATHSFTNVCRSSLQKLQRSLILIPFLFHCYTELLRGNISVISHNKFLYDTECLKITNKKTLTDVSHIFGWIKMIFYVLINANTSLHFINIWNTKHTLCHYKGRNMGLLL